MARKPKLDTTLAEAVDAARLSLAEIAGEPEIGDYLGATAEGERLVTHRFVSHKKGYQGWIWFATLARVPRAKTKDLTVCEVGLIAGEGSLLAPAWVPWADRLAKEEIEAAEAERNAAENGQTPDAPTASTAPDGDESEPSGAEAGSETAQEQAAEESEEADGEDEESLQALKSPARRQVRRRRTAQRTAARRRAAQRNRARKDG